MDETDDVFGRMREELPNELLSDIVEYLDPHGLFIAGRSAPWLTSYVLAEFEARFSGHEMVLRPGAFPTDRTVEILFDMIMVKGQGCRDFVRIFRNVIGFVEINYDEMAIEDAEAFNGIVAEYCGETLVSLKLNRWQEQMRVESFGRPLGSCETLEIQNSALHNFEIITTYFPNVTYLIHTDSDPFAQLFPRLETLVVKNDDRDFLDIRPLWRICGTLRHLTINIDRRIAFSRVLGSIEGNRLLETLHIDALAAPRIRWNDVNRLIREHPTLSDLDIKDVYFDPQKAQFVMERMASLQRFKYTTLDPFNNIQNLPFLVPGWGTLNLVDNIITMVREGNEEDN